MHAKCININLHEYYYANQQKYKTILIRSINNNSKEQYIQLINSNIYNSLQLIIPFKPVNIEPGETYSHPSGTHLLKIC